MAQFLQPNFDAGDVNTVGGYAAVHGRPAAFEGSDGFSYSVEILSDQDQHPREPWGAYFFFVKWSRIGASSPEGHLESTYVARGATEADARDQAGALPLSAVKILLDELIARTTDGAPKRKWWDAMNADDDGHGHSHA
jgi:hypothetical protein